MSKMSQIKRDFLSAMKDSGKEKTKPYDSTATVTRIEGNTAWVHIDGGIDETPVQLTIDAKAGDTVKVRVSGGQAWLTGNGSAPPTDDTVAKEAKVTATDAGVLAGIAKQTADQAGKTATNYLSWSSEYGLIVSEDADVTGGNARITSDGLGIYTGDTQVASFGETVTIKAPNGSKLLIGANSIGMYWSGGTKVFEVDTSQTGGKVYHLNDDIIYDESGIIIDQTGGASDALLYPYATKYDRVVQMRFDLSSSTSIAAGSNIYEGEFAGSSWLPALYTTGVGYYGNHAIVGRIKPDGTIVIRNASPSAVTVSGTVTISFTYILA